MSNPIRYPQMRPPERPVFGRREDIPEPITIGDERGIDRGARVLAWDDEMRMWVSPPRRIRTYICSQGVEHKTYWRTHWRQGREDYVACEHEVTIR